jgi:hypothetical protein
MREEMTQGFEARAAVNRRADLDARGQGRKLVIFQPGR